ncbi:hypothetical protein KEM52_002471 [Ascosphaera acerosa]|nr:hypothetical protein KEM52_002471 [Ascosphaera acerosa]
MAAYVPPKFTIADVFKSSKKIRDEMAADAYMVGETLLPAVCALIRTQHSANHTFVPVSQRKLVHDARVKQQALKSSLQAEQKPKAQEQKHKQSKHAHPHPPSGPPA